MPISTSQTTLPGLDFLVMVTNFCLGLTHKGGSPNGRASGGCWLGQAHLGCQSSGVEVNWRPRTGGVTRV